VEKDYESKDIKASPQTKVAPKPDFPKGWNYEVKRGKHCLRGPNGILRKFNSKAEAAEFANG
jgi:hypothetical protein